MSKFSIVKEIDENVLRNNMYKQQEIVRNNTGDESYYPYIFANKDTLTCLIYQCNVSAFENEKTSCGLVGTYLGNKVFEDNTLKFGEIELR